MCKGNCKGKGFLKKLLTVTVMIGGAALLITKLKKNCDQCSEEDSADSDDCFDGDTSARNYVPLSHGEEASDPENTVSEEMETDEDGQVAEEKLQDASSKSGAPSSEEIAAKLEQAVAETEARYEAAAAAADAKKR